MSKYKERFQSACDKVKQDRKAKYENNQNVLGLTEWLEVLKKNKDVIKENAVHVFENNREFLIDDTIDQFISKAERLDNPPYKIYKQLAVCLDNCEEIKLKKLIYDSICEELDLSDNMDLTVYATGLYYSGKILKKSNKIINVIITLNF